MTEDQHAIDLRLVTEFLSQKGISGSIRGSGRSLFVYAEKGDRAIELYEKQPGYLVEMYQTPEETSVRDELQDTPVLAAEVAVDWLEKTKT